MKSLFYLFFFPYDAINFAPVVTRVSPDLIGNNYPFQMFTETATIQVYRSALVANPLLPSLFFSILGSSDSKTFNFN